MFLGAKYYYNSMALCDTRAMCGGESNSYKVKQNLSLYLYIGRNYSKSGSPGMAFGPAQTKTRTSLRLMPQDFHSVISFGAWSLKIPIGDGYHESLFLDLCHL